MVARSGSLLLTCASSNTQIACTWHRILIRRTRTHHFHTRQSRHDPLQRDRREHSLDHKRCRAKVPKRRPSISLLIGVCCTMRSTRTSDRYTLGTSTDLRSNCTMCSAIKRTRTGRWSSGAMRIPEVSIPRCYGNHCTLLRTPG